MQTGERTNLAALASMPAGLFEHFQGGSPGSVHSGQFRRRCMIEHILCGRIAESGTFTLQHAPTYAERFAASVKTVENGRLTCMGIIGEPATECVWPRWTKLRVGRAQ
ncbi:hypothetical protein D3C87_999030 [compost metagenome]